MANIFKVVKKEEIKPKKDNSRLNSFMSNLRKNTSAHYAEQSKLDKKQDQIARQRQAYKQQRVVDDMNLYSGGAQKLIYQSKEQEKKKAKPTNAYKMMENLRKSYNAEREYALNKKQVAFEERQRAYNQSRSGKVANFLTKNFRRARTPGGFTRAMYGNQIAPMNTPMSGEYVRYAAKPGSRTVYGQASGRRGRPRGTYDQRYAAYGGVYGWRKAQAAALRQQRMEYARQIAVTPQQQAYLNQYQAQQRAQQIAPENQTFPSTAGKVNMKSYHQEIDDFANLVS